MKKHIEYVFKTLNEKDEEYYMTDPSRIFTLYWAANTLAILKSRSLYDLKELTVKKLENSLNHDGGFGGNEGQPSTVVSTFHALQLLFIYDIPFYSTKTLEYILSMQKEIGGFQNDNFGERDTRIDCCGVLSLHLLYVMKKAIRKNNLSEDMIYTNALGMIDYSLLSEPLPLEFLRECKFDRIKTISYIHMCFNKDGGFGQLPGAESHTAQIFCCVSLLRSLDALDTIDKHRVADFLAYRQKPCGGISGRVNKNDDVCYSFWGYAAVKILGLDIFNEKMLVDYIMNCECEYGGFSDRPGNEPDMYHLMFSLASLSLIKNCSTFADIDPGFALPLHPSFL